MLRKRLKFMEAPKEAHGSERKSKDDVSGAQGERKGQR
jgi:hypothetical protein